MRKRSNRGRESNSPTWKRYQNESIKVGCKQDYLISRWINNKEYSNYIKNRREASNEI